MTFFNFQCGLNKFCLEMKTKTLNSVEFIFKLKQIINKRELRYLKTFISNYMFMRLCCHTCRFLFVLFQRGEKPVWKGFWSWCTRPVSSPLQVCWKHTHTLIYIPSVLPPPPTLSLPVSLSSLPPKNTDSWDLLGGVGRCDGVCVCVLGGVGGQWCEEAYLPLSLRSGVFIASAQS